MKKKLEKTKELHLKAIGFWPAEYSDYCAPEFLIDNEFDDNLKLKIIAYLDSAEEFFSWLGFSNCRFRCDIKDKKMGSKDLTDGEWIWPEGFSHYLKVHNIGLPNEFVEHIKNREFNSAVPKDMKKELDEKKAMYVESEGFFLDTTVWRAWLKFRGEIQHFHGAKIGAPKKTLDDGADIDLMDLL